MECQPVRAIPPVVCKADTMHYFNSGGIGVHVFPGHINSSGYNCYRAGSSSSSD